MLAGLIAGSRILFFSPVSPFLSKGKKITRFRNDRHL
jgi:hypothetical protein